MLDLFKHNPTPQEKLHRRLVLSYMELDKDMIVDRMQDGLSVRKRKFEAAAQARQSVPRTQMARSRSMAGPTLLSQRIPTPGQIAKLKALGRALATSSKPVRVVARDLLATLPWRASGMRRPNGLGRMQADRIVKQTENRWGF